MILRGQNESRLLHLLRWLMFWLALDQPRLLMVNWNILYSGSLPH